MNKQIIINNNNKPVGIKSIFSIQKFSFLLLVLPYLGSHFTDLVFSPFFNYKNGIFLIIALIAIDLIARLIISKFHYKEKYIIISFITITILFFYGFTLVNPIHLFLQNKLNFIVREKIIFLTISLLLIGIQVISLKKKINLKIFNSFLLILFIMTILNSIQKNDFSNKEITNTKNNYHFLNIQASSKPVILIIVDEYNSPDNLFKLKKDSTVYNLDRYLKMKSWETKTNSISHNASTVHSLGSIFNYNISNDSNYTNEKMEDVVVSKLFKSQLIDSLKSKGVSVKNYGIFDIGENKYMSRLYLYPRNFFENFLLYTSFMSEKSKTGSFQYKYIVNPPLYIQDHNRYILNQLPSKLNESIIDSKTFIYIHLYMPHNPFNLEPEFYNKEVGNFNRYFAFWKFTNNKLKFFLDSLTKENKYRIILTGDHGFRSAETNPFQTYTAFYGFEKNIAIKMESVQDLGILINQSY